MRNLGLQCLLRQGGFETRPYLRIIR